MEKDEEGGLPSRPHKDIVEMAPEILDEEEQGNQKGPFSTKRLEMPKENLTSQKRLHKGFEARRETKRDHLGQKGLRC